jgi:hypothetical protein
MATVVSHMFIKVRVCVVMLVRHFFARESDGNGSVVYRLPMTVVSYVVQ